MSAPIAPAPAAQYPVAQAPVAQAPVAQAPVAQAPVAQAPVAQAPVAQAPVAQYPTQPPVAQAPVAGGPATVAPPIGTIPSGSGGGIPDEHFNKPILFRLLSISQRASKYEKVDVLAPTVDYIVLDPATGGFTEVRNVVIMQKNIRNELVTCYQRGDRAVAAVAVAIPGANDNPAKVLRALDDSNSGYGAAQATQYLADAAKNTFAWWAASA